MKKLGLRKSKDYRAIIIILAIAAATFLLASLFDLHHLLDRNLQRIGWGTFRGDELMPVFLILALCFAALSYYRRIELAKEIDRRGKVEKAMVWYHDNLKEMVEERTREISDLNKQVEFILGTTKTGIDIIDSDYNMVYIDKEWGKVYGDPEGKKCYEYFMGRTDICPGCGVMKALETKKPVITEEVLAKEGNRPVQVTTVPYQNEKGDWLVAEINIDITERKKVDALLHKNERRLNFSLESAEIGVWELNLADHTAWRSLRHDQIFGYKRLLPAWTYEIFLEHVVPEDRQRLDVEFKRALSLRERWHFECRIIRNDGAIRWIVVQGRISEYDELNRPLSMIGLVMDITDRKEADEKKTRLEALETIMESMQDMVVIHDLEGRITSYNRAASYIVGMGDEHLGKLPTQFAVEEDRPRVMQLIKDVVATGLLTNVDMSALTKDGRAMPVNINLSLLKDSAGNPEGIVAVLRDMTERRQAEAALEMSEANYRAIFEMANDAIIIRDIETFKITDVNPRACEMYCCPKEKLLDQGIEAFITDDPKYGADNLMQFYNKAAKGEYQIYEWQVKDKADRTFWVETNLRRAIIGGRYRFILVERDITQRKQLLDLKDSFINTVSHELRTPLTAIKEGIAIVSEGLVGNVEKDKKECLDIAKRNVDRLKRLLDNLLDFQKLEAGKAVFKFKENNINEIVSECYEAMHALAGEKGLRLVKKLDRRLPRIRCDRDKIMQVLANLLNNAIKFTKKGSITIATAHTKNVISVSVKDTGIGIRKEDMLRMFNKFEQAEDAAELRQAGTGLGLAICKDIIERHGGRVWAESALGAGSTFYFILPVKERRK